MINENIPVYDVVIGDDGGVDMISVVDVPAIGVDFIKLSEQKAINFVAEKSDRQLLYGPFLIPNMLIYRNDPQLGEYYVRFSSQEIEKIADKFNESLNNKNINLMHTDKPVDGFVSQNWLIENENDKSKMWGFDLPIGTWFGAVKIKDSEFWTNQIKNDEVRGFSVEIKADLNLALKNKNKLVSMNDQQLEFNKYPLEDGKTTVYSNGDLQIDTPVFIDDTMQTPAPDGTHTFADGTIIEVKSGKITKITPKDAGQMAVDPNAPMAGQITAEEVSMMIDQRFGELMDEITRLKVMIESQNQMHNDYRNQIDEKFAMTAGQKSIKEKEVSVAPSQNKFTEAERRIRDFAKIK